MIPTDQKLYDKIKSQVVARVHRWPSAYASGQVIHEYKEAMTKIGKPAFKDEPKTQKPLARWFSEKWVDIKTGKPCGSVHTEQYYPTCRPSKQITSKTPVTVNDLSQKEKTQAIKKKQTVQKGILPAFVASNNQKSKK
jgi:Family of unknown function (DUF5872)